MSFDDMLVTHVIDGQSITMSLSQKNYLIKNQPKESVLPIRLVMIRWLDNCQFCSDPTGESAASYVSYDSHMGFISCSKCESKRIDCCHEWIKNFGHGGAKSLTGKNINVKRSSGEIENDWELSTDNYYTFTNETGLETVCCKKIGQDVSKYCLVSELLELNKS